MSSVKLHQVAPPKDLEYDYGKDSTFDDYEVEELQKQGVDDCWYWYKQGGYEGSGQAILRKDGRWYMHDCGHCSCNGPVDRLKLVGGYETLEQMKAACSPGLLVEMQPLFDALAA